MKADSVLADSFIGYTSSPIGLVEIVAVVDGIIELSFVEEPQEDSRLNAHVEDGIQQVSEYFLGERRSFQLPLSMEGSEFRIQVWEELLKIPYGQTRSYQDLADAIGNPKATRAVGLANGLNPIALIVPCHRVIGSDGSLTGYGGGLWRKEWLLKHEGAILL